MAGWLGRGCGGLACGLKVGVGCAGVFRLHWLTPAPPPHAVRAGYARCRGTSSAWGAWRGTTTRWPRAAATAPSCCATCAARSRTWPSWGGTAQRWGMGLVGGQGRGEDGATGEGDKALLPHQSPAVARVLYNPFFALGSRPHPTPTLPAPLPPQVCGLRWSPDDRELASGGNDNQLFVWHQQVTCPGGRQLRWQGRSPFAWRHGLFWAVPACAGAVSTSSPGTPTPALLTRPPLPLLLVCPHPAGGAAGAAVQRAPGGGEGHCVVAPPARPAGQRRRHRRPLHTLLEHDDGAEPAVHRHRQPGARSRAGSAPPGVVAAAQRALICAAFHAAVRASSAQLPPAPAPGRRASRCATCRGPRT